MALELGSYCSCASLDTRSSIEHEGSETSLKWQKGSISLLQGIALLEVSEQFKYLNPSDAHRVLEQWGNKNASGTLGMLFPSDKNPMDQDSWGIVITYEESGHISDDDANRIDYNKLLTDLQEGTSEYNKKRKKNGEHLIELVGWATEPRYDSNSHKLYWAKELRFTDGERFSSVLNYNIRILGRKGVIIFNAVASMNQLKLIQSETPKILDMVQFTSGNRYEDYQPGIDKLAAYGLTGLIAAGVGAKLAAKAGFIKVLIAALLAAKKFLIFAVVVLVGYIKTFFSRRKKQSPQVEKIPTDSK